VSPTKRILETLGGLRTSAISTDASLESAGLQTIAAWSARELVMADEQSRAHGSSRDAYAPVSAVMDRSGNALATALASLGPDGYSRERAVARLAADPRCDAGRLIALRTSDAVEEIRDRAWRAMAWRTAVDQAVEIVPVLVRLSGRQRGADGLDRYAAMFDQVNDRPLWNVLLDHPDRDTQRWAHSIALSGGHIDPQQAVQRLATVTDQWLVIRLVRVVCESQDVAAQQALLTSRRSIAHAMALMVVPDEALPDATICEALVHRTARVREAASYRASLRGLDISAILRAAWEHDHNPTALRYSAERGTTFALSDVRGWMRDPDPRVRAVAVELLAFSAPEPSDIESLFALLNDADPGLVNSAARALIAVDGMWPYQRAACLWTTADAAKRRVLWRLLRGRGGWDRVRAGLLAAADPDPELRARGREDLDSWARYDAPCLWSDPTSEQAADIAVGLPAADINWTAREVIGFRGTTVRG
jgi:hypothetical protein